MATDTKAAKIETSDEELFPTTTVETRGRTYKFRELTAEEYDNAVEMSTRDERLNAVQLLRHMIIKGSVDPKLSGADVAKMPFGVVGAIGKAVNDLHFGPEDPAILVEQLERQGYKVEPPETTEKPEGPKGF